MWKYIKRYFHFALLAALFMIGEVLMDLLQPSLMAQIVYEGVLLSDIQHMNVIFLLGIKMILLVLFGGLCGFCNNTFVQLSGQNIGNEMRKDCFQKIMHFSFSQMDQFLTGSLITRVTYDISQVQTFITLFVRGMIRTFLLMFGSIYFMFRLNHHFGFLVLCAFPFIVGCLIFCLYKADPLFVKLQKHLDNINEILQEDISGIRIIKACTKEIYEKLRFEKANDNLIKTQLQVLMIFSFMNPIMNAFIYIVIAFILYFGFFDVLNGLTTPGHIMAAITYTTQLLNGILMLVMLFQNISRGLVSWKRIDEILKTDFDLENGKFQQNQLKGKIQFCNVSFTYPNSQQSVLKHINLTIDPGETIAIMGTTGCGKSSLVNLIPRFYDISEGQLLVDNRNVKDYDISYLRDKIAITLQKSELFNCTIKENITWKENYDKEKIKKAAKIAQAEEFILAKHDGYDTVISQQGMNLSGGQKQRISIARSILKQADILIFDDSTSALDLKTEALFYDSLQKAYPNKTKIIVAQRIATARHADKIVVLEDGMIQAIGCHEKLMKTCSAYQDIYYSQIEGDNHNE